MYMNKINEWIKQFDWSFISIIKLAVGVVVVTVAVAIIIGVLGMLARSFGISSQYSLNSIFTGETMQGIGGGMMDDYAMTPSVARMASSKEMMYMPEPTFGGGDNPEDYEHRSHSASFKTRHFERVCTTVSALKEYDYVLFDSTNMSDNWCSYSFRVEVAHEDEVRATLEDLQPRDMNVSSYSVEQSVEGNEQEIAMLKERLASQRATLAQAESSFNSLIATATRAGDTSTLSEVINNKINTIDKLTQQILTYQERLTRLEKNQDATTRQITYAQFDVSVERVQFFDGEALAEAWKNKLRELAGSINAVFIALTLGLLTFVLGAVLRVVYASIVILGVVIVARILWKAARRIWQW